MDFRTVAFNNFYEMYISNTVDYNEINIDSDKLSAEQNIRYKQLISYSSENLEEIILYIEQNTINWKFERINSVEKVCLILGVAELSMKLTKMQIVIAEWVKLADKHSSRDGAKFVNGVLDKIYSDLSI